MKNLFLILILIGFSSFSSYAQSELWTDIPESAIEQAGERYIIPEFYRTVKLNLDLAKSHFGSAPMEFTDGYRNGAILIPLPMPDGSFQNFAFWESPTMEPELQALFPEIRTYTGQGIDDPYATLKFDFTPHGFHAQILSPHGRVFIDPYSQGDVHNYISYYTRDFVKDEDFICHTEFDEHEPHYEFEAPLIPTGPQLRTYRLANAATGEYTIFHGGTIALGLAAVTTSVNRVNGIYEREVAVRMILVANNNLIIYTDPNTDPYSNFNGSAMLTQNISNLNSVIGSANYDIGHVFSTGGGGVAYLGVVCTANKGGGVTGSPSPIGDPFDVDYVAHEMGHQFNARHTFNGNAGSCSGNRTAATAYEPGSGSTIMAYAGICGSQNLQSNSDAYFHTISFDEMVAFTHFGNGNSCAVITNTGNSAPVVANLSGGFYIPKSTPFALTGSATDPNGDPLTYCWEEFDLGNAGHPNSPVGDAPIFRSFNPVASQTRTFPKLSDLLNNTQTIGEILPSYGRNLKFRLTVRDNRAGGGGVDWKQINFAVDGNSGPFVVTSPNTNVSWTGNTSQTVTWNVANTNASPVNCSNVRILLSTDGGNNFNTVILSSTPNDGSQIVTIPNLPTTQARIKVEAVGNIFFDISNVNFTILDNPSVGDPISFNATPVSNSINILSFLPNANNNNVVIVWNLTGAFSTPVGTPPPAGGSFAGGILLYNGISSPFIHSGLVQGLTYYYKAFSYDGLNYSAGVNAEARTFYAPPYFQTFDDPTFPPIDWIIVNDGNGNDWIRTSDNTFNGDGAMMYSYDPVNAANSWAFTPGFSLISGKKYFVTFYQRVQSSVYPEKLKVTVGNAPNVGAQTTILWNNDGGSNLTNTNYIQRFAEFTAPSTGIYYFAFHCYSDADMWNLYVDEISIIEQPAIDLALTQFYQASGLPVPRPNEKFINYSISMNKENIINGLNQFIQLNNTNAGVKTSDENYTEIISGDDLSFNESLSDVNLTAEITNLGANAASYLLNWFIDGTGQTPYSGPTVNPDNSHIANLTYTPLERGTFNTVGVISVSGDENPNNNINYFRMRIYPDVFTRTINDRGDNIVDSYAGWGASATSMKAGVRFTSTSTIKLAGVDFIYRTESVNSGIIIIQIRGAGATNSAPGALLYTRLYDVSTYFPAGEAGDYIHFAFGEDAPVIASGSDYWITVKFPSGIEFPGGIHNTGFISGRSFYESNSDTTIWNPLVITTERAWIMRSVEVEASAQTFQLTVSIEDGWNMVSVPGLHPVNQNVNTWWIDRNPAANVFKFDNGYVDVTDASPGEGYWMLHVGNRTYNTGDEWPSGGINNVPNEPLNGNVGWNLIGGYEQAAATSGITTTPSGLQQGDVFGYSASGGYSIAANLIPGFAYWLLLNGSGQIIIPGGGTFTGVAKTTESIKPDWVRIIITDNVGKSYILYGINGKEDLNNYLLPPKPPAGMFDVRYGSGRYAEDLNSAQTVELSGVEYPVTLRLENVSLKVEDETGKIINTALKPGEEVVISNPSVGKLMLSGNVIPEEFSLEQNYPNPFNPTTKIKFTIPVVGTSLMKFVQLKVYDMLGSEVATVVNEYKPAGRYEIIFDASTLSSGIYFYTLRAGSFSATKKMILTK